MKETWLHDGVALVLPSWWASRARFFLVAWLVVVAMGVGSLVPPAITGAPRLDHCQNPGDLLIYPECAALEQSPTLHMPHRLAWRTERVCALGQAETAFLLGEADDVFLPTMLDGSRLGCARGWGAVYPSSTSRSDMGLMLEIDAFQDQGCTGMCEAYASELADREWVRLYGIQHARLREAHEDWNNRPWFVRDGWLKWVVVCTSVLVLSAVLLVVWIRLRRPIRLRFAANHIDIDGQVVPLESLLEAFLDGNRVVFITDRASFESRALALETIVEVDRLLDGVHRQDGREDPASLKAVRTLLGREAR